MVTPNRIGFAGVQTTEPISHGSLGQLWGGKMENNAVVLWTIKTLNRQTNTIADKTFRLDVPTLTETEQSHVLGIMQCIETHPAITAYRSRFVEVPATTEASQTVKGTTLVSDIG